MPDDLAGQPEHELTLDEKMKEGQQRQAAAALESYKATGNPLYAIQALAALPADDSVDPKLREYMRSAFAGVADLASKALYRKVTCQRLKSRSAIEREAHARGIPQELVRAELQARADELPTPKQARGLVAKELGLAGDSSGKSNAFEEHIDRTIRQQAFDDYKQRLHLWKGEDKRLRGAIADQYGVTDDTVDRWFGKA